jgi:hypothetical protein
MSNDWSLGFGLLSYLLGFSSENRVRDRETQTQTQTERDTGRERGNENGL